MIYIGDYIALGLILVLCVFFYDTRPFVTRASKYYGACLILSASTAALDLLCGSVLVATNTPVLLNVLMNSAYFLLNIISTTVISLFFCLKILENVYDRRCVIRIKLLYMAIFLIYAVVVFLNIHFGWLFSFSADGAYIRGPYNGFGYLMAILQMAFVVLCYFNHRGNVTVSVKRAVLQSCLVIILYVIYQRSFKDIMLNSMIMAMLCNIMFLNFQVQRLGKHSITKLNDRVRFFKDIEVDLCAKERMQVFLVHIKKFSEVNRKYGNKIADEVLYQFAFALEDLFDGGKAYHMNGTTFSLVLPYVSDDLVSKNRKILSDFLKKGVLYMHRQIHLDCLMVEYITGKDEVDATDFYEKLEYTSALAKFEKKDYLLYSSQIGNYMKRMQYLLERMQHIDRAHGFKVFYQPVYDVKSNRFTSMEALVRLYEPDGSLVSPGEFIPLAEKNGYINPITWFVLEESCRMISSNPLLKDVSVSVNLPMVQLIEPDFENRLNFLLSKYGVSHEQICLEFTERAIIDDFEKAKDYMIRMSKDGYRFFLDDFGTGYSNFNLLLQLPFDNIKLDRSLCVNMGKDETGERLVKLLISFFHDMNLVVISEGAETENEVELLSKFGIDKIQGFYYAKPMPEEELNLFYKE